MAEQLQANADELEEKKEENTGSYSIPDTKDKLLKYLHAAMALELSTLPLYITAWLSFKDDLSKSAKAAKGLVHSVIMQEMLHMNLVNNVTASIFGVDACTTKFNIPYGKGCKLPANVRPDIKDVLLMPYCKEVLWSEFIKIEAPTSLIQHQTETTEDGSIRYPYEPKKGENSVTLTFEKRDHLDEIGEFYNVIEKGMIQLSQKNLITFKYDDKEHQQELKAFPKQTKKIETLPDALEAIKLICEQGEGYPLGPGGGFSQYDGNGKQKSHFIRFVECLVGKKLISLKVVEDKKDTILYKFTYGAESDYKVDFAKEIYPMENFLKPAEDPEFNDQYKDMLEKLSAELKTAKVFEKKGAVHAMGKLPPLFKKYMVEKKGYPTFEVKDFPLPPKIE